MEGPIKKRQDKLGEQVTKALQARHFAAYYCPTGSEALAQVISLIPKEHTVSWGGSVTLQTLGVQAELKKLGYKVLDRDAAGSPAERTAIMRQALLCDTFLMSSNALSEDGQLFNIDGTGNRLAAMIYGPQSVIVVAGMNKVVKTLEDAVSRTRNFASPVNAQRFAGLKTACSVTGSCADCTSPESICTYLVTTRISRPPNRIKVVLVGETLGF